jgi:hypothetical protein
MWRSSPEYLCFGSVWPVVTVQYAINNAQSVRNITLPAYIGRFSSSGLLCMQKHVSDIMFVYELEKYTQIQQLITFSEKNKRNFDADFVQNYYVFTGYSGSVAQNVYVGSLWKIWLCFQLSPERYIIVTRKAASTLIDIYERSNGWLAFQMNSIGVPNGCGIIVDQLFVLTDNPGMISTNILSRTDATLKSWPCSTCRQGWTNMAIDSSGRTRDVHGTKKNFLVPVKDLCAVSLI